MVRISKPSSSTCTSCTPEATIFTLQLWLARSAYIKGAVCVIAEIEHGGWEHHVGFWSSGYTSIEEGADC
jgi:hypothetical protein